METISLKRSNTILIIGVLIAFLYYPSVGFVTFKGAGYTVNTLFISRLFIWLEVALLYFYARLVEKENFLLWPDTKQAFWFYPASFGALYLLTIGAGIISKIPMLFGLHDNRQIMLYMLSVVNKSWPLLIFSAVTAGFTEEMIFRGYLLPRLELLFKNKYMPVIISSLMFGLIHFRYQSYIEVIFATLFGVVFAIHYQWYRNIRVLIFTHACVDLVSFLVFRLAMHYHLPIK
ncbi:CPBP family intramembrane glutamic endopeptidase [Mucilaginibacter xinganensis]|uniref:CAAX amino terminal protease self-immunity n=1 Tax=Mucilaginibacter xinganensis TaxID=1234841 RepID=A0A223NTD0_9SPHI|nr:type II CAAX endopeptidase family protein [Mucilaginibacter xinganensis]ASU33155.1 CAAX amino terminal protease self- immunity [Mucilaginibacter xinganensis]